MTPAFSTVLIFMQREPNPDVFKTLGVQVCIMGLDAGRDSLPDLGLLSMSQAHPAELLEGENREEH